MQIKTIHLANIGIPLAFAGVLKLHEKNKVDLLVGQGGDDLCCVPDVQDLKACHKCQSWEQPEKTITARGESGLPSSIHIAPNPPQSTGPPVVHGTNTPHHPVIPGDEKNWQSCLSKYGFAEDPLDCGSNNTLSMHVNENLRCMKCKVYGPDDPHPAPKPYTLCCEPPMGNGMMMCSTVESKDDNCPAGYEPHHYDGTIAGVTGVVAHGSKDLQTQKENDLCCWTNGLQTFDCHLCQPPNTSMDHLRRTPVPSSGNSTLCCMATNAENELICPISATKDGSCPSGYSPYESIRSESRNIAIIERTAEPLQTQDESELCCRTNIDKTFVCWLCKDNLPPTTPAGTQGQVEVYKQKDVLDVNTFKYELVQNANGLASQSKVDRCCVVTNRVPFCFDCPSATSATAPAIAAATEAPVAQARDFSIEIVGKQVDKRATCCIHSGVVLICSPNYCDHASEAYIETSPPSFDKRQQTYDFHLTCNGKYDQGKHKCNKGKSTVDGSMCSTNCRCDNLGGMHCGQPAGTDCNTDEMTDYCVHGSPFWGCACSHVPDNHTPYKSIYPPQLHEG